MLSLVKLARWLLQKFATGVLIVVVGVAIFAGWLYLRNNADFEAWRQNMVRTINGDRTRYQAALADVNRRLAAESTAIAADQRQLQLADKVIGEIKGLDSVWARYFGDQAQQSLNRRRLASVEARRASIAADLQHRREAFTHATWERDGLQVALGKQDAKLQAYRARRSAVMRYVDEAWNHRLGRGVLRLPVKDWVFLVLGLYFVGPSLGKLALYFLVAPVVVRGRPVRLAESAAALPQVGESHVAADLTLGSGERLWIKEKFLQASDEGLRRKTRYLLDWRIPLTCIATGLVEMIEMAHDASGGTDAAGGQRLTLSNQGDPHSELAIVTLPAGASLVLRPSFLAGVVTKDGQPLRIRRRWQLFRWQAWVTLQFRFFEFVGPCRLILAGSRGLRVENLADRQGPVLPARRTNQDATVGFTPNLDYRPVRAETFWSYYRGMNPLFDDLFAGRGVFLCQQVASEGEAKQARKFWAGVWGGVMKVFGL